jgi:arylsulfatase
VADTTETTLPHIDELGTPQSYNHYCTGWAWAFDTPFPYWKRWAGYEGGVADMCLIAWPKKIKASQDVRHQYIHAVDVVPTVYDLLGIEAHQR